MTDEPRSILEAIERHIDRTGHAPSPEEVYDLADFSQPGGIGRLCDGLARYGQGYLIACKRAVNGR